MNDVAVDPASLARPRRSERRFWAVWAILVGSLIVAGVASRLLSQGWWFALVLFLYFGAFKVAALIALNSAERRHASHSLRLSSVHPRCPQAPPCR